MPNSNWPKPGTSARALWDEAAKASQATERLFGVPAGITFAQWLLESNGGKSDAGGAKNYFGVKADERWAGPKVLRRTKEWRHGRYVTEYHYFRAYPSMVESFVDHAKFLLGKRYRPLFKLAKGDFEGWANGLRECGYATDPAYSRHLISLDKRYALRYLNLAA